MDEPKTPAESGESTPPPEPIDLTPREEPPVPHQHDVLTMPLEEDTDPLFLTADEPPIQPEEPAGIEAGPEPVSASPEPPAPPEPIPPQVNALPRRRPMGVIWLGVALGLALVVIAVLGVRLSALQAKVDVLMTLQDQADAGKAKAAATQAQTLVIISAVYGSGQNFVDVTARVNDLFRDPAVEFDSKPQWLQADPTPGWKKELIITYEFKGQRHTFMTGEGGRVDLARLVAGAKDSRE